MHLIVTQPFGDYAVGDAITDTAAIEAVRSSVHASCAVAVNPAPEPKPVKE